MSQVKKKTGQPALYVSAAGSVPGSRWWFLLRCVAAQAVQITNQLLARSATFWSIAWPSERGGDVEAQFEQVTARLLIWAATASSAKRWIR